MFIFLIFRWRHSESPDLRTAIFLNINADGTLNGDANSKWTYNAPWLQMDWSNGYTDKVFVQKGRDWENKKIPSYFQALITRELLFGKRKNNYRTGMIIRTNI